MIDMLIGRRDGVCRAGVPASRREQTAVVIRTWRIGSLAIAALLFGAQSIALAQKPASIPNEDNGALQYVIAGLVMLVISVTGFLKANRSHKA